MPESRLYEAVPRHFICCFLLLFVTFCCFLLLFVTFYCFLLLFITFYCFLLVFVYFTITFAVNSVGMS